MKARHRKSGGMVAKNADPKNRIAANPVEEEAKERKRGGKTVEMHGSKAKHHAGRMPRKSGGRAGSNMNPLSSAHAGTAPVGRKGLKVS